MHGVATGRMTAVRFVRIRENYEEIIGISVWTAIQFGRICENNEEIMGIFVSVCEIDEEMKPNLLRELVKIMKKSYEYCEYI